MTIELEMNLILIVYSFIHDGVGKNSSVRKKKTCQWSIRVIYWIAYYTLMISQN